MKIIIILFVLLLLIGGGGAAYFMMMEPEKPDIAVLEGEEEEQAAPEPEAPKAEEKKKEDPYAKFDYKDPGDRMRARSRALQEVENDRKETMKFLLEIDTKEKSKKKRDHDMQRWVDKN